MKYLKTFESYSETTLSVLSEINKNANKYNLPEFKISGEEKEGKWYKDFLKSDICYICKFDERTDIDTADEQGWEYCLEIGVGKNKEERKRRYTSDHKYYAVYHSWYTRQLGGGYQTQKMDEETKGFDNLEDTIKWCKEKYDKRDKEYPYLN